MHKMGLRGSDTAAIGARRRTRSTDERCSARSATASSRDVDTRLGPLCVAAGCVGICQGCVDESVNYAAEREQFGRPIASFQLVQRCSPNMMVDTDAARMLVWRAGYLKDAASRTRLETSIAKSSLPRPRWTREHRDSGPRRSGYVDDHPVERSSATPA